MRDGTSDDTRSTVRRGISGNDKTFNTRVLQGDYDALPSLTDESQVFAASNSVEAGDGKQCIEVIDSDEESNSESTTQSLDDSLGPPTNSTYHVENHANDSEDPSSSDSLFVSQRKTPKRRQTRSSANSNQTPDATVTAKARESPSLRPFSAPVIEKASLKS